MVFQIVIVSDNNSLVVSHVMAKLGIDKYVDLVKTNPAEIEDGIMVVSPHHVQVCVNEKGRAILNRS